VESADQQRQRSEVDDILRRFQNQPGVILADEVGMGKTFVALGVAYSVSVTESSGPVIVMAPPALITKWVNDLGTFASLYVDQGIAVEMGSSDAAQLKGRNAIRYGVARHSIELMRLLDDPPARRSHIIFLAQGAMSRKQTDKWIRLALIAETLGRHGRGVQLSKVKKQIHRFLAQLISAVGEERAHELGPDLWELLLKTDPAHWMDTYNGAVPNSDRHLRDDPVPKAVVRAVRREALDLRPLAEALKAMPLRAVGSEARVTERIKAVRVQLREIEGALWSDILRQAKWRSPLLILDEAHHLKNSDAGPARQLRPWESEGEMRTGDGAMAHAFDRMLFLTATPFQLGHQELVNVLMRFADVRPRQAELEESDSVRQRLRTLGDALTTTQRAALRFQGAWARLNLPPALDTDAWWPHFLRRELVELSYQERACVEAYHAVAAAKAAAEVLLRPWVVRHNKGHVWAGSTIVRRERRDGARMLHDDGRGGLTVPAEQILPFYLAARSAVSPSKDLLGEALSSSFEAFRHTRGTRAARRDSEEDGQPALLELSQAEWYLAEFDLALTQTAGASHPKMAATVKRVVDLWEAGEKVVVFGFYVQTCRYLRVHISQAIEKRLNDAAANRLRQANMESDAASVARVINAVQDRFFDRHASRGRKAMDGMLAELVEQAARLGDTGHDGKDLRTLQEDCLEVMRRFLRARSSIARSFPLDQLEAGSVGEAARTYLDFRDRSGHSWREKFQAFLRFLVKDCSDAERREFVKVVSDVKVGGIGVDASLDDRIEGSDGRIVTLPNVQVATGDTRRETRERLMRAFNTPFFPEILVCSQVMGEGVDLQRHCRHVIHHDLDWNPSTIEQRTGRIDRLGCKAAGQSAIVADLPYIAGAADERQYHVMSERERWFRVVMGQGTVNALITPDSEVRAPLPGAVVEALTFDLAIGSATP